MTEEKPERYQGDGDPYRSLEVKDGVGVQDPEATELDPEVES